MHFLVWKDGHVAASHLREPWDKFADKVIIHDRWDSLKNLEGYEEAKRQNNYEAAVHVVQKCISNEAIDRIVDIYVGLDKELKIVRPLPSFDDEGSEDQDLIKRGPTNAIPAAFQAYLQKVLDIEEEEQVLQVARVGRTKLDQFSRFLYQPRFRGNVSKSEHYIIVDDVISSGGTFAALRSEIVRNSGSVAIFSALAHNSGRDTTLAITDSTLYSLIEAYGPDFKAYWMEAIGHDIACLTEAEASLLVHWAKQKVAVSDGESTLQLLRTRIDSAASNRE